MLQKLIYWDGMSGAPMSTEDYCEYTVGCILYMYMAKISLDEVRLVDTFNSVRSFVEKGHAILLGNAFGMPIGYVLWSHYAHETTKSAARHWLTDGKIADAGDVCILSAVVPPGFGFALLSTLAFEFSGRKISFKRREATRTLDLADRDGNNFIATTLAKLRAVDQIREKVRRQNLGIAHVENQRVLGGNLSLLCRALADDPFHSEKLRMSQVQALRYALLIKQFIADRADIDGSPYMIIWAWLDADIIARHDLDYFCQLPRTDWNGGSKLVILACIGNDSARSAALSAFKRQFSDHDADIWYFPNAVAACGPKFSKLENDRTSEIAA